MEMEFEKSKKSKIKDSVSKTTYHSSEIYSTNYKTETELELGRRQESEYQKQIIKEAEQKRIKEAEQKRKEKEIISNLKTQTKLFAPNLFFNGQIAFISQDQKELIYELNQKNRTQFHPEMLEVRIDTLKSYVNKAESLKFNQGECKIELLQLSTKEQNLSFMKKVKFKIQGKSNDIGKEEFHYTIRICDKDAYHIYTENSELIRDMIYGYCYRKNVDIVDIKISQGSLKIAMIVLQLPGAMLDLIELTGKIRLFILNVKKWWNSKNDENK